LKVNTFITGLDGFIKLWYFETIDTIDPQDENRFIELEPMMEFEIKNDDNQAALMCMVKISEDSEDTFWYGQVWAQTNDKGLDLRYSNYDRTFRCSIFACSLPQTKLRLIEIEIYNILIGIYHSKKT
jgi:hypothetical protein